MSESLLLRFLLNAKSRVDNIARYSLDTEVVDVIGLFQTLVKLYPVTVYPLPKSLLKAELPQYGGLWEAMPDNLSDQEDTYCMGLYRTKVGRAIALSKFAQKKTNPEYVKEMWEDLGQLFKDIDYEDVEEEFDLSTLKDYIEEDRKLLQGIIPTPFTKLNNFLGGGFLPQRLYVFESTSKVGKSTLLLYIGMWLANQGFRIKYVSTELLGLEARERVASMVQAFKNPLEVKKWDRVDPEDLDKSLAGITGYFSYKFLSCPSMTEIETYLRGQLFDLLILDHPSHTLMRPKQAMGNSDEWKVVKSIYRDIFKFARESKKAVLLPSWVNRAGHESLIKHHDAEAYHTAGAFDTNAILDAKFLVIPRQDLKTDHEYITQIKPLFLRRKGSHVDLNEILQLAFNDLNYLYREVPTQEEEVKKAIQAMRSKLNNVSQRKTWGNIYGYVKRKDIGR